MYINLAKEKKILFAPNDQNNSGNENNLLVTFLFSGYWKNKCKEAMRSYYSWFPERDFPNKIFSIPSNEKSVTNKFEVVIFNFNSI